MRPDAGVRYELLSTPLHPADAGVGLAHAAHGQLWAEVTATSVSDLHVGSVGSSVGGSRQLPAPEARAPLVPGLFTEPPPLCLPAKPPPGPGGPGWAGA